MVDLLVALKAVMMVTKVASTAGPWEWRAFWMVD
jgi:hypothetical protein